MPGFYMTDQEKQDLLAFLHSLTDEQFLTDPRLADPFVGPVAELRRPAVPPL